MNVLITGGTGSLGQKLTAHLLSRPDISRIVIFSRDEQKQCAMSRTFTDDRLRFFLGDIRDSQRLGFALRGIDTVYHTAALKHVDILEYNPFEAVATNITGSANVIRESISAGVPKVVGISTDKACSPVTTYGATKLVMERLFSQANSYSDKTRFSCVRYGNVSYSNGSVIPKFLGQLAQDVPLTVTHKDMTRFWITLPEAIGLIDYAESHMQGGEVYIPALRSYKLMDLARTISDSVVVTGIRPGEKIHELLFSADESRNVYHSEGIYVLYPEFNFWNDQRIDRGAPVGECREYSSADYLMNREELSDLLQRK